MSNVSVNTHSFNPEHAKAEAAEFCREWDAGLDGNELIDAVLKLSPVALEIVADHLQHRAASKPSRVPVLETELTDIPL
jgi:hypothetical protein